LYHLFDPEVRKFCLGKTILNIKVVRPDKKAKDMYLDELKPAAIKIYFSDGTSIQIDSWSEFVTPHPLTGTQHKRQLSYLTSMVRSKQGLALMKPELEQENKKRRNKKTNEK